MKRFGIVFTAVLAIIVATMVTIPTPSYALLIRLLLPISRWLKVAIQAKLSSLGTLCHWSRTTVSAM